LIAELADGGGQRGAVLATIATYDLFAAG